MAVRFCYPSADRESVSMPMGTMSGGQASSCPVRPAIVLVLGFPGTGKLTVSRELVTALAGDGTPTRLVDNHTSANILFDLIAEADGRSLLPPGVLDNVRQINLIVARTIEQLSPPEWSFVFTHHLRDSEENRSYLHRLETVSERRGSTFLPVVLTCERDALLERVARPERRSRNKLVDRSIATRVIERGMLIPINSVTIDTTFRGPAETATMICEELSRRSLGGDL